MPKQSKTVPNQWTITIQKEPCSNKNKEEYYAQINLNALENAAKDLDAGAFKLWIYFAKNQQKYQFALSRQAIENNFGMKKDQYDSARKKLVDKGYLIPVIGKTNHYIFNENPVVVKTHQDVAGKNHHDNQDVVVKTIHEWQEKTTRNITNIDTEALDITNNITASNSSNSTISAEPRAKAQVPAQEERPEAVPPKERIIDKSKQNIEYKIKGYYNGIMDYIECIDLNTDEIFIAKR